MLNSMIDRRQLNTRYAIQVEVELKMKNGSVIEHVRISNLCIETKGLTPFEF